MLLPNSHLPDLSPPIARLIRALMDDLYIDIGATIIGVIRVCRRRGALLEFLCLIIAYCETRVVQGIHAIGLPKGAFNMNEARKVFEAGEDVRLRALHLVREEMPGAHGRR